MLLGIVVAAGSSGLGEGAIGHVGAVARMSKRKFVCVGMAVSQRILLAYLVHVDVVIRFLVRDYIGREPIRRMLLPSLQGV